eukprot:5575736-Pyramimonas_sp.AAC.1
MARCCMRFSWAPPRLVEGRQRLPPVAALGPAQAIICCALRARILDDAPLGGAVAGVGALRGDALQDMLAPLDAALVFPLAPLPADPVLGARVPFQLFVFVAVPVDDSPGTSAAARPVDCLRCRERRN